MTATGHAIIGTAIAAKVGNPALAIPIAVLSHIAADSIPHWDVATNGKPMKIKFLASAADVTVGFIVSFFILDFLFPQTSLTYAFVIILASQSLDWFMSPYYFFGIKSFKFFYTFQKLFDRKLDKPWGIINQVAILALIVILAKIF